MKLKNVLLTAFVIMAVALNFSNAQQIDWGTLNTSESSRYYPDIIGEDDDNIYTFASLKNEYIVEAYDKKDFKKKYSHVVDQPKIDKNSVDIERIMVVNGKFLLFASYFDKQKDQSKIYAYIVNSKTGKIESKRAELFSVDVEKKSRKGDFDVFLSKDRSKVLLNHYTYYKKQKEYVDKYVLIDSDLNIIVERKDVFKKNSRDYSTSSYIIDNDGSLYFLKKYDDERKSIVSYDANKDYEKWEEFINPSEIGLQNKERITDVSFVINDQNDLILSGYYSKEKNELDGCFFMKIDNLSKEIVVSKISVFSDAFKQQFLTNRQKEKGKERAIKNVFKSIDIATKQDGGIVLSGELYSHTVSDYGESWFFGDVIVLNLSSEGELEWAQRVPKQQLFYYYSNYYPIVYGSFGVRLFTIPWRTIEHFSYFLGIDSDNVYLVFNDNPKNFTKPLNSGKSRMLKKIKKAATVLYSINLADGSVKKSVFVKGMDNTVLIKPSEYYQRSQLSAGYVLGQKRKYYKFGEFKMAK